MFRVAGLSRTMMAVLVCCTASNAFAAEGGIWSVSKSSGEVWVTARGAGPVSLTQEEVLKPGDTIRTGRTGRVLLKRGEETILLAPNTVIGLPAEQKEELSTTILQQAGSILLDVEKRNVKHFEVETPYLAAVVKGTQFAVTVNAASTTVEVRRGQVEVADFKSGQIAQVNPGQTATAFANGKPGLSLGGSGPFSPIEQGRPRAAALEQIPVPRSGLSIPRNAGDGKMIHAHGNADGNRPKPTGQSSERHRSAGNAMRNVVRISVSLGEVRLNVHKATHGLAHGSETAGSVRRASTVWSNAQANVNAATSSNQGSSTNSGTNAALATSSAASAASAAATTAGAVSASASGKGKGNGNGNGKGNGNGNGNGETGNGKGNGNNGNHGNGNNGNGNGNGHGKH